MGIDCRRPATYCRTPPAISADEAVRNVSLGHSAGVWSNAATAGSHLSALLRKKLLARFTPARPNCRNKLVTATAQTLADCFAFPRSPSYESPKSGGHRRARRYFACHRTQQPSARRGRTGRQTVGSRWPQWRARSSDPRKHDFLAAFLPRPCEGHVFRSGMSRRAVWTRHGVM